MLNPRYILGRSGLELLSCGFRDWSSSAHCRDPDCRMVRDHIDAICAASM